MSARVVGIGQAGREAAHDAGDEEDRVDDGAKPATSEAGMASSMPRTIISLRP